MSDQITPEVVARAKKAHWAQMQIDSDLAFETAELLRLYMAANVEHVRQLQAIAREARQIMTTMPDGVAKDLLDDLVTMRIEGSAIPAER